MKDIDGLRVFYKLKSVYRLNSVQDRKESTAEHTWSALILADYYMETYDFNLDKLKVFELIMYHDVVEIEAGDTPLHPDIDRGDKEEIEAAAAVSLHKQFPKALSDKFLSLHNEYEAISSKEAAFAKCIGVLDTTIHEMDYKEDWKGWSRKFLENKKMHYFEFFPHLKQDFVFLLNYLEENGYFDQ